jgi:hypothetical protein
MSDWMSAKSKTLMVAAVFLALAASHAMDSADGSVWVYSENKTDGGQSFNVSARAFQKGITRSVLRFSFQTKDQCATTVGLASYGFGNGRGRFLSSAVVPEEWAVQVDDQTPEQGPATDAVYSNSWEILLPVSSSLVNDAKSGSQLRMWQTGTGKYPPPPERRSHVELSLPGAARLLERAEASCAEALRR